MATITIADLDKAEVLAALYNAAHPQGAGFLHYDPTPMTAEEARALLARMVERDPEGRVSFDYLKGRVMKVDLSADEFDPRLYDRDNGPDAAETVIQTLRVTKDVNERGIAARSTEATQHAAQQARAHLAEEWAQKRPALAADGISYRLGLNGFGDALITKLDAFPDASDE